MDSNVRSPGPQTSVPVRVGPSLAAWRRAVMRGWVEDSAWPGCEGQVSLPFPDPAGLYPDEG